MPLNIPPFLVPTVENANNSNKAASTEFVKANTANIIADLTGGAPANRDTLKELSDAIDVVAADVETLDPSAIEELQEEVDQKAPLVHTHPISAVEGLQEVLDGAGLHQSFVGFKLSADGSSLMLTTDTGDFNVSDYTTWDFTSGGTFSIIKNSLVVTL